MTIIVFTKRVRTKLRKTRRARKLQLYAALALCLMAMPFGVWNGLEAMGVANPLPSKISVTQIAPGKTVKKGAIFHIKDANKTTNYNIIIPQNKVVTVADALTAADVALDKYDRVKPSLDATVHGGMTITVTRVAVKISTEVVTQKPQTRYKVTAKLGPGKRKVKQYQRTGKVEITKRTWIKNGKVSMTEETGRKTLRKLQNKIILLGVSKALKPGAIPYHSRYARSFSLSARGGSPRQRMAAAARRGSLRVIKKVTLRSTAYSNSPAENGGWSHTATGMPIVYGIAAVDPRVIPLGTKMYIPGYGFAFAADTGGAIKGHRIDLAMSRSRVYHWGRRKVTAYILGP